MMLSKKSVSARLRSVFAPVMAVAALALAASAFTAPAPQKQKKPSFKVEASRGAQGAILVFQGKNWPAGARIRITATRAPGTNTPQDFGYYSADEKGEFKDRTVKQCTTTNIDDATERVTFTAADSATGEKVTQRVDGSSWLCM